jgi:hypothetical protein
LIYSSFNFPFKSSSSSGFLNSSTLPQKCACRSVNIMWNK